MFKIRELRVVKNRKRKIAILHKFIHLIHLVNAGRVQMTKK
jgi:hypothetical protein